MNQYQGYLGTSKNNGVDKLDSSLRNDSENLKTHKQDGAPSVAVDSNIAKSFYALELSSGQLLIGCAVIFLLLIALFWFLYDVGEWLPRLRRRLRRWRESSDDWGDSKAGLVGFPMIEGDLAPLVLKERAASLDEHSESTAFQTPAEFIESEPVETVEPNQEDPPKELKIGLAAPPPSFEDTTAVLEFQSGAIAAPEEKREGDGQANEIETLTNALDQEKRVALEDAESRYQKLTDELAESKLAQAKLQTDLDNANQSIESLAAKNTQTEQEMEAACQELRGKGDFVGQLESKLAESESLAESLEEKLRLAQADLESQVQQTLAAETKIKAVDNDTVQLQQQLEEQRESLTAQLAERTNELENRLNETVASVDEKTASLEESEARCQRLANELEDLKRSKTQTQSELETAQQEILLLSSNAEQTGKELDTAYQLMLNKGDIATGLHQENEKLKSTLQQVENQLATVEADAKQASESKEAIQAQLNEDTNRYEQSQQKLEAELDSARREIAQLQQHAESSESELAQNATKHAEELGNLKSWLEEAQEEKQTQLDQNEKLNSIVAESESALTSARAEIAELKSELSASTAAAEQTSVLHEKLEEANAQAGVSLKQIDSLTSEIGELENRLGLMAQELEAATASQEKSDEQWAELDAQSKLFQQRANEAELELAEVSQSLATRQTSFAELEKSAQQNKDELTLQVSKNSALEASVESFESRMLEAQRELVETANLLEQEKSNRVEIENTVKQQAEELNTQQSRVSEFETRVKSLESQLQDASEQLEQSTSELNKTRSLQVELEKTTEQQKAELSQRDTQYAELETKLRETVESNSSKLTSESQKLERQELEFETLRIALQNETAQRSEILGKLEASQIRIAELEQQAKASTIDESNFDELVQRLRKYKTAYRKNMAVMEGLAERKTKMSKLATEYLACAKVLRGQLDEQLGITADLKQQLKNASSGGVSPAELKLLVQERALADVLALKAEFETRLKKKNETIQKLKNRKLQS